MTGLDEIIVDRLSLSRQGRSVDQRLPSGETLLTAVIDSQDAQLVQKVIQQGANVNKATSHDVTPLEKGVREGTLDIVNVLIQNGAKVNQPSRFGFSPLQIALCCKDIEKVKLLLRHGANSNGFADGADKSNSTHSLILSFDWGEAEAFNVLLNHGCTVDSLQTIKAAMASQIPNALEMVLSNLASKLQDLTNSCTLLSIAAQSHDCQLLDLLLKHGIPTEFGTYFKQNAFTSSSIVTPESSHGRLKREWIPPLAACIHYDCKSCFQKLLSILSPNNINYVDELGLTPLCYAMYETLWSCNRRAYPKHGVHCYLEFTQNTQGLSDKRLNFIEKLIVKGANIDMVFTNPVIKQWDLSESMHSQKGENAYLLLLRAQYFEISSVVDDKKGTFEWGEVAKRINLCRRAGISGNFLAVLLYHLQGYQLTEMDITVISVRHKNSKVTGTDISNCLNSMQSAPRTLQNIAVLSIRKSLANGVRGKKGNIVYAADALIIPKALRNQITMKTMDGLIRESVINGIKQLHELYKT